MRLKGFLVSGLASFICVGFFGSENVMVKAAIDNQTSILQNTNVDAFIESQKILGRKCELISYDENYVFIETEDAYLKKPLRLALDFYRREIWEE